VWVMRADGSGKTNLMPGSTGTCSLGGQPSWSPDGASIAYFGGTSSNSICAMNADGSGRRSLTGAAQGYPAWSPDGTKIAYAAGQQIWAVNADGSVPIRLTADRVAATAPDWSPDGTRIVYQRGTQIWAMNADGGAPSHSRSGPIAMDCAPRGPPTAARSCSPQGCSGTTTPPTTSS